MQRIRLSTLMLLIVVAAMGTSLIIQHFRHRRTERELLGQIAVEFQKSSTINFLNDKEFKAVQTTLEYRRRSLAAATGAVR